MCQGSMVSVFIPVTRQDTEGCILIGKNDKKGWVSDSRLWTSKLIQTMKTAWDKKEKVTIVIQ